MNFQIPQFLSTYMYKNKGVPLEKAYILAMGWEESHLSMFKKWRHTVKVLECVGYGKDEKHHNNR